MIRTSDVRGFTLLEVLMVGALIAIVSAIALPAFTTSTAQITLSSAARQVERELQSARMKAVRADRVIRVRFNCPAAGQYRTVELLGTPSAPAADDFDARAVTRCGTAYPYPDTDTDFFSIPNNDGALKQLPDGVAFNAVQSIEFHPDGSAHASTGTDPWPLIGTAGVTLSMYDSKRGWSSGPMYRRSITVNSLGKITLH